MLFVNLPSEQLLLYIVDADGFKLCMLVSFLLEYANFVEAKGVIIA